MSFSFVTLYPQGNNEHLSFHLFIHKFISPYFHLWRSFSTLPYKPATPTIPLFAQMKGKCSKRQLYKSFMVVIQPFSTCLIKPNFWFTLTLTQHHSFFRARKPFTLHWMVCRCWLHLFLSPQTSLIFDWQFLPLCITFILYLYLIIFKPLILLVYTKFKFNGQMIVIYVLMVHRSFSFVISLSDNIGGFGIPN